MIHRVVVTGHAGVRKRQAIEKLKEYILRQEPSASVEIIEVERKLKEDEQRWRGRFLYTDDVYTRYLTWFDEFRLIVGHWTTLNPKPKYTFLLLNLSFHSQSQFFSALEWAYPLQAYATLSPRRWWRKAVNLSKSVGLPVLQFVAFNLLGFILTRTMLENIQRWIEAQQASDLKLVSQQPLLDFLAKEFQPTLFVNLYDNVYSCKKQIVGYHFRLNELLRWRNVEMLFTDIVANIAIPDDRRRGARSYYIAESGNHREQRSTKSEYPFECSPSLSINHPPNILYRLITRPDVPRVYLSFPISSPRRERSGDFMNQINQFRRYMGDRLIAFDPLCIDEKILELALIEGVKALLEGGATLSTQMRNLLQASEINSVSVDKLATCIDTYRVFQYSLKTSQYAWRNLFSVYPELLAPDEGPDEMDFRLDEVFEIAERKIIPDLSGSSKAAPQSEIEHQITSRDYRLIDQADCVVVYRPTRAKDEWEIGGTLSEALYALAKNKPVVVIIDKADGVISDGSLPLRIAKEGHIIERVGLDSEQERERAFAQAINEVLTILGRKPQFENIKLATA